MSHAGMTGEQGKQYAQLIGSFVKAPDKERIDRIKEETGAYYGTNAREFEKRERMLAAIEEARFEMTPGEYNRAMHTVLDVLQYLVER